MENPVEIDGYVAPPLDLVNEIWILGIPEVGLQY
jgi:hypothetical protein